MKNQDFGAATLPVKKASLGTRIKKEWQRNYCLYIFAIPIFIYFIMFKYVPMFGLVIAFKNFSLGKGVFGSDWVGFKYFMEFFNSVYFTRTLTNTLTLSILSILFNFPFPIIFALLLNEIKAGKLKRFVQTSSYLPHFISMVVICGIITDFCSSDGLITSLIVALGGDKINYLADSRYFRTIFVTSGVWQTFGWSSIIYIAALTGIDEQLYEAAAIDGATRWQRVWHITIPGIANTIIILLIMRLGHVLSVGYEKVILLYTPQTYDVADIISSYNYRLGIIEARYGYSTAVGLFQSIINIIVLVISNGLSRKYSETSLF